MKNRTIIRTTFDIFFNNSLIKSIKAIVNFCYEQQYFSQRKLKFSKNVPINNMTGIDCPFGQMVIKKQ